MNKFISYCFLTFVLLIHATTIHAQCTTLNVVEAVVNGDFERGNNGSFSTQLHDFTPNVLNNPPCEIWGSCNYSQAGDFLIGTNHNNLCPSCWQTFDSSHVELNGKAMFVDGPTQAGVTIWQQTVTVFPNQTYFFTANIAMLDKDNPSSLQFFVNNTAYSNVFDFSQYTSGIGGWFQISASYVNKASTSVVIRLVSSKNFKDAAGNDFVIDDISFINSCQNSSSDLIPDLGPDINICNTSGTVTLDSKIDGVGNSIDFFWYEGEGQYQMYASTTTGSVANPSKQKSIVVNKPGVYRVCINDDNNCPVSSTIIITNTLSSPIQMTDYCASPSTEIKVDISGQSLQYKWNVPALAVNPGNSDVAIGSLIGMYTVTATGLSGIGWSCSTIASTTISNALPTYNDKMIKDAFCQGSVQTVNNLGTGVNAANYKWYDAIEGGQLLSIGINPSFTMPTTGSSFDVYLEDFSSTSLTGSPIYDTTLSVQSTINNSLVALNIFKRTALQSVKIRQQPFMGSCVSNTSVMIVIELVQNDQVINTVKSLVTCNVESVIPLNFVLPPSQYVLRIKGGTDNNNAVFYSTSTKFTPAEIPEFVSVLGVGFPPNSNGPFASMVFKKLNACDRVPVSIPIINCCTAFNVTATSNSPVCVNDSIKFFCSESSMKSYQWAGPSNFESNLRTPSIHHVSSANIGVYTLTVTNSVNCTNTSTLIVNVNSIDTVDVYDTIPKGDSLYFSSSFVKKAGLYSHTYENKNGCDSIVQLWLAVDSINKYYRVSGNVYIGNILLQNGTVKLLSSNAVKSESAVKTTSLANGYYQFNFIKQDKYLLVAQSLTNDGYLPTYFGDKINSWQAMVVNAYGNVGNADIHLVQKVNDVEDNAGNNKITVFPNPVKDKLILGILVRENSTIDLQIYDVTGKFVATYTGNCEQGSNSIELNTQAFEAGYYLVKAAVGKDLLQIPFVK